MKLLIFLSTFCLLPFFAFSETNKAALATNQFAFELYKLNAKKPGNLFFSPLSIEAALAMTSAGAQKETLSQMTKTLHLSGNYHPEFQSLLGQLKGSKDFQLFIANRIWGKTGTTYDPAFLKLLRVNYAADLAALDFNKQPEPSRLKINQWVEQQTKEKIKDLLIEGDITAATDLVLTNAIYFRGSWATQFEKDSTKNDNFTTASKQKVSIPFMHLKSDFSYAENSELQLLELNYKGKELVMNILLPKKGVELGVIENKMNPAALGKLFHEMKSTALALSLPKFKAESKFELSENLTALGMPLPFDPKKADFHGIRKPGPGENLYISKVIHKAFVDVNEEGTEAAAATAVIVTLGMSNTMSREISFTADHPFLFLIRHVKSGAILFMGRFSQP